MNPQETEQWRLDRAGSIGASEIADVMRKLKNGGISAARSSLMARKIAERLTGKPIEGFLSRAMQDGKDREPMARAAYELKTGNTVEVCGIVRHPVILGTHASPDGLIGEAGLCEIKCPEHAAHLGFLLTRDIGEDYLTQMQWQMACTGREWCDFVSYHPDFPEHLQLSISHVERNDAAIAALENGVRAFIEEMEEKIRGLERLYKAGE